MDYEEVRKYLGNCYFSEHARREMEAEPLGIIRVDDVSCVLRTGEIIEDYPEDKPYPSCLVLGRTAGGRPLHVVCAPAPTDRRLIIITVYQPDPTRWDPEFKRRRAS
jgi:hypothetical protein